MHNFKLYTLCVATLTVIFIYLNLHKEPRYNDQLKLVEEKNAVLIYNRVPKTGSTSLMNIAYELHRSNRFRVVQVRLTGSKNVLSLQDQISISQNISGWSDLPMLFHGHFSYFDPLVLGVDIHPVFINLIRKPLDRLVSYYYFLRYGDDVLDKIRSKAGDTTTFDECVEQAQPDCDPKKLWMQIPFFCGSSPNCWEPGSQWALDQAKYNLVNKYLVVGVTEDLESFAEVLEYLLPQFFTGATQYLRDTGKTHIKRTKHKDSLSAHTMEKMQGTRIYHMEMDFYNFAAKHFRATKKSMTVQKEAAQQFYVYEKVKPKL